MTTYRYIRQYGSSKDSNLTKAIQVISHVAADIITHIMLHKGKLLGSTYRQSTVIISVVLHGHDASTAAIVIVHEGVGVEALVKDERLTHSSFRNGADARRVVHDGTAPISTAVLAALVEKSHLAEYAGVALHGAAGAWARKGPSVVGVLTTAEEKEQGGEDESDSSYRADHRTNNDASR